MEAFVRKAGLAVLLAALFLSSCGPVEEGVVGALEVELGQKVALELTGGGTCPCACGPVSVHRFSIRDSKRREVFRDQAQSYPVPAERWIGRWDLAGAEGPVPPGRYTVLVETSVGAFQAEVRVVGPGLASGGWETAEASVCGVGLWVYRLVEEGDGPTVSLRVGDLLLVALPGNPTTGYRWEVREAPPFLAWVEGVEYRASSDLIGAGGTFYFRYAAVAPGGGPLTLVYSRPWEDLPPLQTFSLYINVQ